MQDGAPRTWHTSSRVRAAGALVLAAALAGGARADCPGDPAPLAAVPVEARAAFLRERLAADHGPAQRWTVTWGIVDGALVAGQLAALPFTKDRATQALLVGGAASGALAFVQMIFFPVAIRPPPPDPGAPPCEEVAELERELERGARNQRLGAGPVAHAGNALINAALGIGAGFASDSFTSGALTFAIGWTIGEAQILTQPTDLVRDRDLYRRAELAPFAVVPAVRLGSGGALVLGLDGTF